MGQTLDISKIQFWHRVRLPDGTYTPGRVNHGPDGGDWPTTRFAMPENLTGKTVLDVGAWDGFFSFEAERRGAEYVLASDCGQEDGGNWAGPVGFVYLKAALGSKVGWAQFSIEAGLDLAVDFDLVLCYGVLYHLKSPLRAMQNLAHLTKRGGQCLLETAISDISGAAVLEYRPRAQGDALNYFYPNGEWVELAARESGFSRVEEFYRGGGRATFVLDK